MAGICTNSIRKSGAGCDHRLVTVALDGESFDLHTMEAEIDAMPWTEAEKRQFILLGLKRLRTLGMTLDAAVGRVTNGEEATNVKAYALLGPGSSITKTNIGTAYVNVLPGPVGQRIIADFTGCTEFLIVVDANFTLTGAFGVRVIRDSDSAVLYENAAITAGDKQVNTGWLPIPQGVNAQEVIRLQAKSTTAADDPVFRSAILYLR